MSRVSRRKMMRVGLGVTAGATGLAVAAELSRRYGLIPPDAGGIYGPGETLTYAAQRLVGSQALAREFDHSEISAQPFPNAVDPLGDAFERLRRSDFADWRLTVDGMVARPAAFSVEEIRKMPARRQITQLACEEGWSYIAEWTGTPLAYILERVGAFPNARYVIYRSIQPDWWESIDMAEALHPQTVVAHLMNYFPIQVRFGGPLRMRVPRQLGYKSVKYLTSITVTNNPRLSGEKSGTVSSEDWHGSSNLGYAWYAGI